MFDSTYESEAGSAELSRLEQQLHRPAIPQEQMQEWLHGTVDRIRARNPQRILEIGCGVGLLVEHLAPAASVYVGTDLSLRAVRDLRRWMASQPTLAHVLLRHAEATDFTGLQHGAFDTVIVNSVAQYLPDADYLLEVMTGAARVGWRRRSDLYR